MKKIIIVLLFVLVLSGSIYTAIASDSVYANKLFSITLPENLNGTYEILTEKDKISVFHTESKNAGFGGFAFGVKAYKNPADHATLPGSKKIGELIDKKGNLYDVVIKYPTDVQYDYTITPEPPKSFKLLYDFGETVKVQGVNGSKYYKNRGTKGEDLYESILQKHFIALKEKWDSSKLEKENMSYMYNITGDIGYIFQDINADGIDELLIGEIADGSWKGVIYDMYTMVNREPKHVVSGGNRNRFYVCDNTFICNEYSSGALESGVRVYNLVENSTELFPQVSFKFDGYASPTNPWFLSYGNDKDDGSWENVSKEKYDERKKVFEQYERFNYIPLKTIAKTFKPIEDKYNLQKDYFDYSVVLNEFPKDYYYTTVKINKSNERILIVTDKINGNNNSNRGLFYYFAPNGFVYPLGYLKSTTPFSISKNYLYMTYKNSNIKFYMSDNQFEIVKSNIEKIKEYVIPIEFVRIKSAEKFACDFGEAAGDDVVKATLDGYYFEYHKPEYKKKYIENLMKECINDGVKTQVQMYCCVVNKLHR